MKKKTIGKEYIFTALILFVVLAVTMVLDSQLPSYHIVIKVIKKASVYSLVAVSMNLLNGFTGLFSLGQAGFMLLGAYSYAVLCIPVAKRAGVYQYFDGGIVKFSLPERKTPPVDQARRAFLINGGVLVAGVAAGMVLAKTGMGKLAEYAKRFLILPPGAGDAERFAARCTACQLCTANCPAKIIVPAPGGDGPVSLDLSCGACQAVCPAPGKAMTVHEIERQIVLNGKGAI